MGAVMEKKKEISKIQVWFSKEAIQIWKNPKGQRIVKAAPK
jgi:hypothetical protein